VSALVFEMKDTPDQRLDLSPLVPERLNGLSRKDIQAIEIGTTRETLTVGDAFKVKGKNAQEIHFDGTDERCDKIGAKLAGGEIFVDGDVGSQLGARMTDGKIELRAARACSPAPA
jgi:formylmethanofuran dehydrogenase subunit C